jgi:hypothetical protein
LSHLLLPYCPFLLFHFFQILPGCSILYVKRFF